MIDRDILAALGGHNFIFHCVNIARRIERGVRFELPPGATKRPKLTDVTVTMERNDGYTIRTFRREDRGVRQVAERHEIEAGGLKTAWHQMTGIDPERGWIGDAMARLRQPAMPKATISLLREIREMADAMPPPVPRPRIALPPRLLFMSCGGQKDPSERTDIAARDRYTGSWWNVLRLADPERNRCAVAFMSAKLGMGDADWPIPFYERKMTTQTAAQMIERGVTQGWPPPQHKTLSRRGMPPLSPLSHMQSLRQRVDEPFREVAIVGGHLYQPVMQSFVVEFQKRGLIAPDAEITVIQDKIGLMLRSVRQWVEKSVAPWRTACPHTRSQAYKTGCCSR